MKNSQSATENHEENHETIQVRSDLKVHIRNDQRIVLEDPARGKHYRLGPTEYDFFVSLRSSGNAATAHRAAAGQCEQWDADSSQQLLSWLASRGLISLGKGEFTSPLKPGNSRQASFNPLFARFSCGTPEVYFSRIMQWVRPFLRREVAWAFVAFACFALGTLATSWQDFQAAYNNLLTPWRAASLAIVGVLLKLLHETAHGVACHQWGGKVRDCGVAFIFGIPLPFVDLTDSCRFPNRSHRVMVALAGVLAECLVAALLICTWSVTDSPTVARIAADTTLVVALGAILFNLNPLMKFDGYYVCVEFMGIDNLYSLGANYVSVLRRHILFGHSEKSLTDFPLMVKLYGLASFVWRTLAWLTIYCTAIATLHGIGVILVIWTLFVFYAGPAIKNWQAQKLPAQDPRRSGVSWRLWLRPIGISLGCVLAVCTIPLPIENSGNAVVEYDPPAVVRTLVDGFVDHIHVADGQQVLQGDLLVTLRSDRLPLELAARAAQQAHLEQELRSAVFREDSTEYRHIQAELEGVRKQRAELLAQHDLLVMRAPAEGVVSTRNLTELLGGYLESGTEIAVIGLEDSKRLRLLVQQESVPALQVGDAIRFLSVSGSQGIAQVERIAPRTSQAANGSTLSAEKGGPVSVEMDQDGIAQFCSPHSQILASMAPHISKELRVGQRVSVALGSRRRLGEWIWDACLNQLSRS